MVEIIAFNQDENLTLEAIAYELSVLIPRYLETLDKLEEENDLHLFLCWLSNSFLYRKRLKSVFDFASSSNKEFCFEDSMLQSLQVELEVLELAYSEIEEHKRFVPIDLNLACQAKERVLGQMIHILQMLGIKEENEDLQAVRYAQEALLKEKLQLSVIEDREVRASL
ncbi:hypothetical protein AB751O23_AO_00170 [Chlamydiales bacterium SCGC AB-751-O23]|jgi:hypothetical protein|nr:hypothetical protein AB751O23_AO_00170 [Chlamydiales bacterium SCGC AB-751-O23]